MWWLSGVQRRNANRFEYDISPRRKAEAAARMIGDFIVLDKFLLDHAWQRLPQVRRWRWRWRWRDVVVVVVARKYAPRISRSD